MLHKKLSLLLLPLVTSLSLHANDPFFNDPFGDNIFKEMMQMQEEMDKMFQRMQERMQQRTTRQIAPLGTYNIQNSGAFVDKGSQYEYVTNIPQSKENQINISSQNGMISITAKIIKKEEVKTAHGYSSSSSMRMYQQTLTLPDDADEKTLTMLYRDGYLVLTVDKKKEKTDTDNTVLNEKEENTKTSTTKNLESKNETGKVEDKKKEKEKIKLSDDTSMS